MKPVFLSLLICLVFQSNAQSGWEKENIKGKVKAIYETNNYPSNSLLSDEVSQAEKIYTYDTEGNQTGLYVVTAKNDTIMRYRWLWDKQGNNVAEYQIGSYNGSPDSTIRQFQYNVNGKLISEAVTASTLFAPTRKTYLYDSLARIKEVRNYMVESFSGTTIYGYMDSLSKQETFDTSGVLIHQQVFDHGKIIEDNWHSKPFYKYTYDSAWNMISAINYQTDKYMENKAEYDNKGNITRQTTNVPGTHEIRSTEDFTYKYDNSGNWIERSNFSKGKMIGTVKRKIIYY